MTPRDHVAKVHDTIAGITLILAGSIALVGRLGGFDVNQVPEPLQHGWPLLLILVGAVLWIRQHDSENARKQAAQRETYDGR